MGGREALKSLYRRTIRFVSSFPWEHHLRREIFRQATAPCTTAVRFSCVRRFAPLICEELPEVFFAFFRDVLQNRLPRPSVQCPAPLTPTPSSQPCPFFSYVSCHRLAYRLDRYFRHKKELLRFQRTQNPPRHPPGNEVRQLAVDQDVACASRSQACASRSAFCFLSLWGFLLVRCVTASRLAVLH